MANGFWRIGRDTTTEVTANGRTGYILNKPSITKDSVGISKPIIIDVGVWKDVTGNEITVDMPIISCGADATIIYFPDESALGNHYGSIDPTDDTLTTFALSLISK